MSNHIQFGDPRVPARFWAKVERIPFSTCWYWSAAGNARKGKGDGSRYGAFKVAGRTVRPYRWLWMQVNGDPTPGLELDHFRCDTPACVNPDHVREVTHRENVLRGTAIPWLAIENRTLTHCRRGHDLSDSRIDARGSRHCRACDRERMRAVRSGRRLQKIQYRGPHASGK